MGMSSVTVDQSIDGKRKADDSFDIQGMVFPLLKAIVTTRPDPRPKISCAHEEQKSDFLQDMADVTVENELLAKEDEDGCETPKSKEHKIPKILECPPAPRKPKPKRKATLLQGLFFVPPDLDPAFVVYKTSPPRKKMRCSRKISALEVEQNGDHM